MQRQWTMKNYLFIIVLFPTIIPSFASTSGFQDGCKLVVDISKNVRHNYTKYCAIVNDEYFVCDDFRGISALPIKNGTCVRLMKDGLRLNNVLYINDIVDFRVYSYPNEKQFKVKCNDGDYTDTGFNFANVSNIKVTNIHFINCGHESLSTVRLSKTGEIVPILSAFYFNDVTNVQFNDVIMDSCHGYGLVLYDAFGDVVLNRVTIASNRLIHFQSHAGIRYPGYSSGGAVYIEYRKNRLELLTKVTVKNSTFFNNTADHISATPSGEGMREGHIGFGRGGAIGIFFLNNIKNVDVRLTNNTFHDNSAAWGGAVYVRFREIAYNNTITVKATKFFTNNGTLSGGGLFVTDTQKGDFMNSAHVLGCKFVGNTAEVGGGLNYKYICRKSIENKRFMEIRDTLFNLNTAKIGYAMNLEMMLINFYNLSVIHNLGKDDRGQGAIYTFKSDLYFDTPCIFELNRHTAILSDCSTIYLRGTVTFDTNVGENGGAISMYGDSQLVLYNSSRLLFSGNRAWRRGGAIYIQQPGPSIERSIIKSLQLENCFIKFNGADLRSSAFMTFKGKVTFINNTANINGDSIFTSSLIPCTVDNALNQTLNHWRGFQFLPNNETHIITHAVKIELNDDEWNQPPGFLFSPKIYLLDERRNHVSEQINVQIWPNTNPKCAVRIETNPRFVVTEYDDITLTLLGNNEQDTNCHFNITVSLAWNNFTSYRIVNRKLKACNFGYTYYESIQRCRCMMQKNRAKGIAICANGKSYFFQGRWAYSKQKALKTDQETTVVCPKGYCKTGCPDGICLYDDENPKQCAENRDQSSKICGSCKEGYSVSFGSEECVECKGASKYNFIWWIVVYIVAFIIIVVFIISLGIDIYSNYLNGLLFYCQVVVLLPPSSFKLWHVMKFIIGVLNMESTGSVLPATCFIHGFNNLHKQAFNYLFPFIMLSILYCLASLAKRPNTFLGRYFANRNCLGAFTIISVFAYTDITRVTFLLLNSSVIDPVSSKRWLWIHGDTEFFGKEHLPYAIAACFIMVFIVLGFPLALVFSPRLVAWRSRWNPFAKMTPVFENFTYCYRKDCLYFASYFFFARLLLVGIDTFAAINPYSNTLKSLACCLICIFLAFNKPYKQNMMNYFDLFVLINLTIVSVLCVMVLGFASPKKQDTIYTLVNLLILLPFIPVGGRMIWVYGKKFYEWIKKEWQLRRRVKPSNKSPQYNFPHRTLVSSDDEDISDKENSTRIDDESIQSDDNTSTVNASLLDRNGQLSSQNEDIPYQKIE